MDRLNQSLPFHGVQNNTQAQPTQREPSSDREREQTQVDYIPIHLTSGNYRPLTTTNLIHTIALPAYPETQLAGHAYAVPVNGETATQETVLQEALQFQYCRAKKGPPKPTTSPYLGNVIATRYRYQCSGVKCCEYLDTAIRTLYHTSVNDEVWSTMRATRQSGRRTDPDKTRRYTISSYIALSERFATQTSCIQSGPQCRPVLQQQKDLDLYGNVQWFIGCAGWSWESPKHFFRRVTDRFSFPLLQELFTNGLTTRETDAGLICGVVESTMTKLQNCDVDHAQGKGQLISLKCDVEINILIPINLQATPYFIFCSHGVHKHPPPPPTRTPESIQLELVQLVRKINDPSLTTAKLLRSPLLEEWAKSHGQNTPVQVHASLANLDRFQKIILRENLLLYPYGQQLEGVQFEMEMRHDGAPNPYIRRILQHQLGNAIICFSNQQATRFSRIETFQVDLSFKRVQKEFNELLFAYFDEDTGKVYTLCRVLMDTDTRAFYAYVFSNVFSLLSEVSEKPFRWKHIHGHGFIGITADMDSKQMAGFGDYLVTQDPKARTWWWHLKSTLVLCQVHFNRSITQCTSTYPSGQPLQERMRTLLHVNDWLEWEAHCNLLIRHEPEIVQNWARHKKNPVIASGLNQKCSLISLADWNLLSKSSNAVEQAANKGYSFGTRLSLLQAIQTGMKMDAIDASQYNANEYYGIRHKSRAIAASARYKTQDGRRKRQIDIQNQRFEDAILERHGITPTCEDDSILFQASSSGFVPNTIRGRTRSRASSRSGSRSSYSSTPRAKRMRTNPIETELLNEQQRIANRLAEAEATRAAAEASRIAAEARRAELENQMFEIQIAKARLEFEQASRQG